MTTEAQTLSTALPRLAQDLLDAGIPVVVCRPNENYVPGAGGRDVIQPPAWQTITVEQAREDITTYRPGVDTLAMVGGYGIDVIDLDAKANGKLEDVPAEARVWGLSRTPGGGWHIPVPSTGYGKGFITGGDYVGGGGALGGSRMLLYLSGSSRPKYPGQDYEELEPWDVARLLDSEPPDVLLDWLGNTMKLRPAGAMSNPTALRWEASAFIEKHSEVVDCAYGASVLDGLLSESPAKGVEEGRHPWLIRAATRVSEVIAAGCLDARALDAVREHFLWLKPGEEADADNCVRWGIGQAEGRDCSKFACGKHDAAKGELDELWEMSSELLHVWRYAQYFHTDASAMLMAVLTRLSSWVPGNVRSIVPEWAPKPAPAMMMLAIFGDSNSGKTSVLQAADNFLGYVDGKCGRVSVRDFAKSQREKDRFLSRDLKASDGTPLLNPEVVGISSSCDEIRSYKLKEKENSIEGTLSDKRTVWSGGSISDENVSTELLRVIPAGGVGDSTIILLLPSQAHEVITPEAEEDGTVYRMEYARMGLLPIRRFDEDVPSEWKVSLADTGWSVDARGEPASYSRGCERRSDDIMAQVDGAYGSRLNPMRDPDLKWKMSPGVWEWLAAERQKTADNEEGALKPHKALGILKMACAVSMLHGKFPLVGEFELEVALRIYHSISAPALAWATEQMAERRRSARRARNELTALDEVDTESKRYELLFAQKIEALGRRADASDGRITRQMWKNAANPSVKLGLDKKAMRDLWTEFVEWAAVERGTGWTREANKPGTPPGFYLVRREG